MLEQLVESKSNSKENRTRGGLLLTTLAIVSMLCFGAVLSSLFAMNLGIGDDSLEMSSLVAPIEPVEVKPKQVEEIVKKEVKTSEQSVDETTRQTNTLRINENPLVPKEISVVPNTQKERPEGFFKISEKPEGDSLQKQNESNRESNGGGGTGVSSGGIQPKVLENNEKEEMPELKKTPVVVPPDKKKPTIVSKGVINSQAKSLPKPVYSQAAKAVRASGDVSVQVTIDETGRVISAKAVTGHTLLRAEAEKAARDAKFTPTILSDQPVKVTGIIVYKFIL
jgi:TonB family protein